MSTEVRPDDARLRQSRRERVLAEMEAHDLDVLILGREANARYVSGAPRYWIAGNRPFGPGCVVVRSTGQVHLLSTWDEGIPDEIPHENLFGITFQPMNIVPWLKSIDGVASARRIGTDALTPLYSQLLPLAFPSAELVDGEQAMRVARLVKSDDELAEIKKALEVAQASLSAAVGALAAGVTTRELAGHFMNAMAEQGVTTPSSQHVAWITAKDQPWRRAAPDTAAQPGDLVAFDAGVLNDGYLGELGRTWPVNDADLSSQSRLRRRWEALWARLLDACKAGSTGSDLLGAYESAGEPYPAVPVARGLGLGYDLPVISPDLPTSAASQRLVPGMVLAVTGLVWQEGLGSIYGQEAVLIGASGPELLSSSPHWAG